jgi:hypothetical protein
MPSSPAPPPAPQSRPSALARLVFILPASLAFVLSIGPSDLLLPAWWSTWREEPDIIVIAAGALGLTLGAFAARPVWRLSAKVTSRTMAVVLAVATAFSFSGLIYLRESGLWPWPLAAGDALLLCASIVLVPVTIATERIHGVKVYLSARSLRFVRHASDA